MLANCKIFRYNDGVLFSNLIYNAIKHISVKDNRPPQPYLNIIHTLLTVYNGLPFKLHCAVYSNNLEVWECLNLNLKLSFNSYDILYAHKCISLTSDRMGMR